MWSVNKRQLWKAPVDLLRRNLIWRYTLFFAVISLLLMAVLFAVLYHLSIGSLERRQQHDIELQASQQTQVAENMSRRHFIQFIESHNRSGSATILALKDAQGVLSFVPKQLSACPQMSHFPVWNDEFKHIQTLAGCVTNTRHGELLVSLDAAPLQQIKKQLLRALAVVGGAALILSL
ncbi:MAG: hypothetical protein JXR76_26415, partial [Deltaproteobacteria bacterium]|nr:hypothetical protein [Deltaproteobacteria bacterium]